MKTLLVGYKAADLTPELLAGDVTCHVLDIYHRHAIEKVHHAKAVCSAHLPEGPWDAIKFRTGPKIHSGELALDLLQQISRLLKSGEADSCPLAKNRKFHLDFIGKERDRNDLINKIGDDPKRVRNFRAEWPASVPGGEKLMFTSSPGCFCHRRLDEGGLALAEVVSRELLNSTTSRPLSLLDMGCGCGLVGLLVANRLKRDLVISLTLVDSHARAVEAAAENAAKFGIEAEVVLADNGIDGIAEERRRNGRENPSPFGAFDVFVGNPPYYSDYRIAEVFLETAKRALKPGGICYTVVKNAAGLKPVQERFFPRVEVLNRRGYCVLKSIAGE